MAPASPAVQEILDPRRNRLWSVLHDAMTGMLRLQGLRRRQDLAPASEKRIGENEVTRAPNDQDRMPAQQGQPVLDLSEQSEGPVARLKRDVGDKAMEG